MATNSAPCYGKQYIRYAETFQAAEDAEAGSPAASAAGTTLMVVEVGEMRVVTYVTSAGPSVAAEPAALAPANWTGQIAGVNQAYMPTMLAQPNTARQLTVATSGLLLIESDPASAAITINTPLQIDLYGRAVAVGQAVTLDGTTPFVRENVAIGGRRLVLVSFA